MYKLTSDNQCSPYALIEEIHFEEHYRLEQFNAHEESGVAVSSILQPPIKRPLDVHLVIIVSHNTRYLAPSHVSVTQ